MQAESGHYVSSATHRLIKDRDFLIFTDLPSQTADLIIVDNCPFVVSTDQHTYTFTVSESTQVIDNNKDVATINLAKVVFPLQLRRWRTGDYLYPFGMGMKKKKVSKLLKDQKMPLHEKENIWVVESEKKILWVAGLRSDERFKVTNATKQVLVIKRTTN
jgi:tRNA(Ile)-lysidine synthase